MSHVRGLVLRGCINDAVRDYLTSLCPDRLSRMSQHILVCPEGVAVVSLVWPEDVFLYHGYVSQASWRHLSASNGIRACPDGPYYILIISRYSILQCARRGPGHSYKSCQCPLYPFVVLLGLLLQKLLIVRTLCPDMLCLYVPPLVLLHTWVFEKAHLLLCICVIWSSMCFLRLGCE